MSHARITLEVCIASVADAIAARDGGADRLELNAALALGGLTPSLGMLCEVRRAVELPLVVMIRPRAGGFCYSDAEFAVMLRDAETALASGANGIAVGVLQDNRTLDVPRCRQLVNLAHGREVVFHRAFDELANPAAALAQLADLGVCRVMTSGKRGTALTGAGTIARLVEQAAERVEILPAGKIDGQNVAELLTRTGCRQVHAALRTWQTDPSAAHTASSEPPNPMQSYEATSPQRVRELRTALDAWQSAQAE